MIRKHDVLAMDVHATVVTPTMLQWSTPGTLFIFAALNMINIDFVWACIKETKGVPLEQIPALFGSVRKGECENTA